MADAAVGGGRTPAQLFALGFGAIYLVVGVAGFVVTGFEDFAAPSDAELIVFALNPLHNLVHILVGALLLGSAGSSVAAKRMNAVVGGAYAVVALLGFLGLLEFLNVNTADNWLHAVTAVLGLYFGTAGAEGGVPTAV